MKSIARLLGMAALLVLGLIAFAPAAAQGNLLQDPGFEGPYVGRGRPDLNTPAAWNLWLADGPRNYEWQNRPDKAYAFPHNSDPERRGGAGVSQNINGGFVTFTAALYQTVATTPGTNLTGSAYGWLKTCNIARDAAGVYIADNCGSAIESGAFVKVGLDPAGGTNPLSPTIVWSAEIRPHDRWEQATVSATAAGGSMTLFLYVTQAWPSDLNRVYFDDASLTIGGAGGTTGAQIPGATAAPPAPPTAAFANFVSQQPPATDGAQYHTAQPGDTMAAIAYAYGITLNELLAANNLRRGGYLRIGQVLLIPIDAAESTAESTAEVGALTRTPAPTTVRPTAGTPAVVNGATVTPFGGFNPLGGTPTQPGVPVLPTVTATFAG